MWIEVLCLLSLHPYATTGGSAEAGQPIPIWDVDAMPATGSGRTYTTTIRQLGECVYTAETPVKQPAATLS